MAAMGIESVYQLVVKYLPFLTSSREAQTTLSSFPTKLSLDIALAVIPVLCVCVHKTFLYYPGILHSNKKQGQMGLAEVVAHRGSRLEGLPENTIAAFKDACIANADVIEFDVWLTLDGKVAVHHDQSLKRMTDGKSDQKINEVKYSEVPNIVPCATQCERIHEYANRKDDFLKIPLLDDVLQTVPLHITINVEFKQDSLELIQKVHELLGKHKRLYHNLYWFSLADSVNNKLKKYDPKIRTITSVETVLKVLALYYLGLLPYCPLSDSVFGVTVEEITLEKVRKEKAVKSLPDFIKRLLAFLLAGKPPRLMCNSTLFAHLRKRGIGVWFLGVNSESDLKIAIESGATGVLTDRVNWMRRHMKEHRLSFKKIVT